MIIALKSEGFVPSAIRFLPSFLIADHNLGSVSRLMTTRWTR